jgi:riboflavin kinase / FMN adenylyltransferase
LSHDGERSGAAVPAWRDLADVPADWGRSVVAIGVFDGVHLGHQAVLRTAVRVGERLGLPVVAVTFDPHPMSVVRPGAAPELLGTVEQRIRLLHGGGADAVFVLAFTPEVSRLTPEDFVRRVLVDGLHTAAVVVGADFRFGHRAAGDVPLLRELGERWGFTVEGVEEQADGSGRFSSTRTRELLLAGEVAEAAQVLGHPYALEGPVVEGDGRGRVLGFPTANIACPGGIVVPADGVYAGWLVIDPSGGPAGAFPDGPASRLPGGSPGGPADRPADVPRRLPAAISVGSNPTFPGAGRRVEAYALDRDDLQLYGRQVAVEFLERLRGMERFESVDALRAQMASDVERSRVLLTPPSGGAA